MPFDVENAVKFDANYMHGFTSEKRDTNVSELESIVDDQIEDIARNSAVNIDPVYDRGYNFTYEDVDIEGKQWKAAYLPIWLYSYYQKDNGLLHYVAVNARTKETHGSVPLNKPKLFVVSALVELVGILLFLIGNFINFFEEFFQGFGRFFGIIALVGGIIFYLSMYYRYRNTNVRHTFELETKRQLSNIHKEDEYVKLRKKLHSQWIEGENGRRAKGKLFGRDDADYIKQVNSSLYKL